MRTFSRKFFAIGLLLALLVFSTGRAIPVSALADPEIDPIVPAIAPVFDTQFYQLQDYIDHGGLGEPQLEIFYILAGLYASGQIGAEDYKINDPYTNSDSVLDWLKSCGIELYNTVIGLAPTTIQLPDGSIMSTDPIKRSLSVTVSILMGCAETASNYDSLQDFEDDVSSSDSFYIPWSRDVQYGLNTLFQTYGGVYEWQFDAIPFSSDTSYVTMNNVSDWVLDQQENTLAEHGSSRVRYNYYQYPRYNCLVTGGFFDSYTVLFLNTSQHCFYICKPDGTVLSVDTPSSERIAYTSYITPSGSLYSGQFNSFPFPGSNYYYSIDLSSYNTYADAVLALYNHTGFSNNNPYVWIYFEDFIQHVFVGDSWANRHEIFNIQDLNIAEPEEETQYYVTVPDDTNYFMDIKGILQDILNNTDLYNVFFNNIYTPDGVLVHDTDLIRVSVKLLEYYQEQNPPIPVNLNDIADYTDNSYLDRVKEEARRGGSTLAALVAFWHNCDPEIIYVLFGAGITVLVGAFIGKWGHS